MKLIKANKENFATPMHIEKTLIYKYLCMASVVAKWGLLGVVVYVTSNTMAIPTVSVGGVHSKPTQTKSYKFSVSPTNNAIRTCVNDIDRNKIIFTHNIDRARASIVNTNSRALGLTFMRSKNSSVNFLIRANALGIRFIYTR